MQLGTMHNTETQNVCVTLDIEAAWQCLDHCLVSFCSLMYMSSDIIHS